MFGLGCFWGAERLFWEAPGVYATAVGYAAGLTPNPTYEEVCSGYTGHNEVVMVWFDPKKTSYEALLQPVLGGPRPDPGHAPGQRCGHAVSLGHLHLLSRAQKAQAEASRAVFQKELARKGYGAITTEIVEAPTFFYAEDYHQQYLAKNPDGYCGLGGTGVTCPIGLGVAAE